MRSSRNQEREAREYLAGIGSDPDEVVSGYWDTGGGRMEWLQAPRWTWYRGANPEWERPLTPYEKAQVQREIALEAARNKIPTVVRP